MGQSTHHWPPCDTRKPGTDATTAQRPSRTAVVSPPSEHEFLGCAGGQILTTPQPCVAAVDSPAPTCAGMSENASRGSTGVTSQGLHARLERGRGGHGPFVCSCVPQMSTEGGRSSIARAYNPKRTQTSHVPIRVPFQEPIPRLHRVSGLFCFSFWLGAGGVGRAACAPPSCRAVLPQLQAGAPHSLTASQESASEKRRDLGSNQLTRRPKVPVPVC